MKRLGKSCKTLRYNDLQLQSASSRVCGQFCIMFLHCMGKDLGFCNFVKLFSSDSSKNDTIVKEFVDKIIEPDFVDLQFGGRTGEGRPSQE